MDKKDLDVFCSEEKEAIKQLTEELKEANKIVSRKDNKRFYYTHYLEN